MAHVRFTQNFDYRPKANVLIAYKAGWAGAVRRDCAAQALAAGKAVEAVAPPRRARKAAP